MLLISQCRMYSCACVMVTVIHCTAEYIEDVTVNVTMIKKPASVRKEGCLTGSKVYQAQVSF